MDLLGNKQNGLYSICRTLNSVVPNINQEFHIG
jgi:hypothetical protein